jgi:hypothetical protein
MRPPLTGPLSVELRRSNRYQVSAQVFFFWAHNGSPEEYGQGITRDINPSGVYVRTQALPQVGDRILVDIMLPKLIDPGSGMHLTGDGLVVRVDPPDERSSNPSEGGFAASIRFFPEKSDLLLKRMKLHGRLL